MRRVFLDLETTGLDPNRGHRVCEIAALAYENHTPLPPEIGIFQQYVNPQTPVGESYATHQLSDEFLAQKPLFADIAVRLADFLRGANIVAHNADFDHSFLNMEFALLNMESLDDIAASITCSQREFAAHGLSTRKNLNAMCEHFGIDTSARRERHSAQVDAELLAKAYIQMRMRMQQNTMDLNQKISDDLAGSGRAAKVLVRYANENELAAHNKLLMAMFAKSKIKPLFLRRGDDGKSSDTTDTTGRARDDNAD